MGDTANEIKLLSGNSHPMLTRLVADRYAGASWLSTALNISNVRC